MQRMESPSKVLFIAASGIGNTILATPLIQKARHLWPNAQFDLLTSRRIFQAPLLRSGLISHFFDLEKQPAKVLWSLRKSDYDISITCFPSNRWQFNVVAGIIGARLRVTHRYAEGNRFAFLMNGTVEADESLHDIEQNLRLLERFTKVPDQTSPALMFALTRDDHSKAEQWLAEHGLQNRRLVGLHVGGHTPTDKSPLMNKQIGAVKSPRVEDLKADIVTEPSDCSFLFFGGEEEDAAIRQFIELLPQSIQSRCHRFQGDLWTTAALVARCTRFISGDTALMHIAAVFNVPQKAYFICTNPSRTAPRNAKATLVVEKECRTYKYPFRVQPSSQ